MFKFDHRVALKIVCAAAAVGQFTALPTTGAKRAWKTREERKSGDHRKRIDGVIASPIKDFIHLKSELHKSSQMYVTVTAKLH